MQGWHYLIFKQYIIDTVYDYCNDLILGCNLPWVLAYQAYAFQWHIVGNVFLFHLCQRFVNVTFLMFLTFKNSF